MEKSRKYLKIYSIVVLVYTLGIILNLVAGLSELNNATIPAGSPDNIVLITKVILMVVSGILLLPQIFIGLKGIKVANNPDSSKSHIVVATILFVLAIFSTITPISSLIKKEAVGENIRNLLSIAVELYLYFDYIKYARLVAEEN